MKSLLPFRSLSVDAFQGKLTPMMFCLGMHAMLAQLVMTRELMVVFYGNELAIGIIFAVWLMMVSMGSLAIRPFISRLSENSVRSLATALLVVAAVGLPLLVFAARAMRIFFSVPMGEYMAFGPMITGAFLTLAPVCLIVGMAFPCACRLAASGNGNVAGIYAAESMGSMIAGMAFSFIFVFLLSPVGITFFAALCAVCGAALIARRAFWRKTCWTMAICLTALLVFPRLINVLEMNGIRLRWESFGVLPRSVQSAGDRPLLISSRDSRYQNLALIKSEDQITMYSNGQVMFVFPDMICAEQKIHFIMAQKPSARKVLLIGGNPVNDIPELLKYPLASLTHVELDAVIGEMLTPLAGHDYRTAVSDPRFRQCLMDGPRFVRQCRETFDVVMVEAPEPTTIALNRFYTAEFYRDINRILAPDGFFYTALQASEHLQNEAANMTASIYRALQKVFPRLLITGGSRHQFFAGKKDAPLTFDGPTLYQRWNRAGIRTKFFRPEYFLNADEISADKTDFVRRRLAGTAVPANSALKPISAFYNLSLWSRYSGSRIEQPLHALKRLRVEWVGGAVAGAILLLILMIPFGRKTTSAFVRSEKITMAAVIAATGFTGMALELILIFMFQTLLGYIYASLGLMVAMFMLGLATGAASVRKYSRRPAKKCWLLLLKLDAVLLLTAVSLPLLMESDWSRSATWPVAGAIYFLTLLTGWAGGAQFILATGLLNDKAAGPPSKTSGRLTAGNVSNFSANLSHACSAQARVATERSNTAGRIPRNAALLNAVDLAGAALGSAGIGIIFLPLFGFDGTCYLLAVLKAGTVLLIAAFLSFNARYFVPERR